MAETNRIEYKQEFFNGISIPRNKELMRIYRNVELVESLGSGTPRILRAYGEESFKFTDNFIRITFPVSVHDTAHVEDVEQQIDKVKIEDTTAHVTAHITAHVEKLITVIEGELNRESLQELVQINHRQHFLKEYLKPCIEARYVELTIPDKPKSINQKYRLTPKGLQLREMMRRKKE